jgi:hypothetical protein
MMKKSNYSIGIPEKKWQHEHKVAWLAKQKIQRCYQTDIVVKLTSLKDCFNIEQYGTLSYSATSGVCQTGYPLYIIKNSIWDHNKPTVLITGGVHGYETSGILGAIHFIETKAEIYIEQFNIMVAPCVSPWGYETINRWNPQAVDPNRSFIDKSPAPEAAALMKYIATLDIAILAHIDLHETTDTDNSEFRPALAARDGVSHTNWNIPDGFYLVGDTDNPVDDFQRAIITAVKQITHIAEPDHDGKLIGEKLSQAGVINYATKALGLCAGFSQATYATTTEVYPDSPKVSDNQCIDAQVAAITGGLDYIINLNH